VIIVKTNSNKKRMGLNLKDEKKIKDAEIEKYFVIL
jgi:hypothetical protein